MELSFGEWIAAQIDRQDEIGDLARMPSMLESVPQPTRRRFDEHRSWADVVVRIAGSGHVEIFNAAWQEFLLAREAADDGAA
jgi:hypothetical protein